MGPPCACVQLSGEGKFAFVEFTSEMMAVTALQLDKVHPTPPTPPHPGPGPGPNPPFAGASP